MSDTPTAVAEELKHIRARLDHLLQWQRRNESATLAAALLGTRRKSLSVAEMLDVVRDIHFARNPTPNNPEYQEWEKTKDERLSRIYK